MEKDKSKNNSKSICPRDLKNFLELHTNDPKEPLIFLAEVGYTYKWSKLELAGATFQDCSTPQNVTSCEGIRSLAPKKAPEPLKKPFRPQMLYTSVR